MKREQLAERIGHIDDRLIMEADQLPMHRKERMHMARKILAAAAAIALMICSGVVGAVAFTPKAPEMIELEQIGLTLILPEEWRGQYGVEMFEDGSGCAVYVKSIHDGEGEWAGQGYLFHVSQAYDEPLTPEQLEERSPVPCLYLFSTADKTYSLNLASDVQYDPRVPEEAELYMKMYHQIRDIDFLVSNPAAIS